MSASVLSPAQAQALFNILTHYETYSEFQNFKRPEAINNFGYPFEKNGNEQISSPILQVILDKFVLKLRASRSKDSGFWQDRIQGLLSKLGEANLSESYDMGSMGIRKTLATAASAISEYIARGVLAGCPKEETEKQDRQYDLSKSEDLTQAWDDTIQKLLYGTLLDELVDQIAKTGQPEDHSPMVKAVVEYVVIIAASFLHYIFILSPEGQYLVDVIRNAHNLAPYLMIRQTLQVGNAATMINGMMRLMLTKLSLNSFTSAFGITKKSDAGMNLLQQIISQIMIWDMAEFRKQATAIENAKDGPSKAHFEAIQTYLQKPREEQERLRSISKSQSKSILIAILENSQDPTLTTSLSESQHAQLQTYFAAHLSIRDREETIKVSCRQQPDLLTKAVREIVDAFEPFIRSLHKAVNLSASVSDEEHFLDDLLELSRRPSKKPNGSSRKEEAPSLPSIEDYVRLLHKYKPALYRVFEQIIKNGPEVTDLLVSKTKQALLEFRTPTQNTTASLTKIFTALSPEDQSSVLHSLDAHTAYLSSLETSSTSNLKAILANRDGEGEYTGATMSGPGTYLPRWQALLDETLITPATQHGLVRKGSDVKSQQAKEGEEGIVNSSNALPEQPDVSIVVQKLGPAFKGVLARLEVKA